MAKILRMFGWAWIYLGSTVVFIGYAATVYFHGFGALVDMVKPYGGHSIVNMVFVLITLAPGFILIQTAEAIERGQRKRAVFTLILFPLAASLSVGLFWLSFGNPFSSRAEERSASMTCADYSALTQVQKVSVAYGYLEGVQAALDKNPVDILVPPSDPGHPMWWVLPAGLEKNPYTLLPERLAAHCQSADNRNKPILDAFLAIAIQKEGSPTLGISFDRQKTDPWKKFLGKGSVSCAAYSDSPQATRQAIIHGYYLGTEALKVGLKSSVDIGIVWPSKLSVEAVRGGIDKRCQKSVGESLRDVLWVTTAELAVQTEPVQAGMRKAKYVEAIDGSVQCIWARDRLITKITGPCDAFTPPRQVRIGETFQANGKTKTINVILADRAEKDFPTLGLKAGDFTCTAAESAANIPSVSGKREHTGTWLYIAKCKPIE